MIEEILTSILSSLYSFVRIPSILSGGIALAIVIDYTHHFIPLVFGSWQPLILFVVGLLSAVGYMLRITN